MKTSVHRIAELEQALYAVLSASQQMGLKADDLRLLAVGGLAVNGSWGWINDEHIAGAIEEVQRAAGVVKGARRRCFDAHWRESKA